MTCCYISKRNKINFAIVSASQTCANQLLSSAPAGSFIFFCGNERPGSVERVCGEIAVLLRGHHVGVLARLDCNCALKRSQNTLTFSPQCPQRVFALLLTRELHQSEG